MPSMQVTPILCDCRNKQNCLFSYICKHREVVYQAKVTPEGEDFFYIGSINYIKKTLLKHYPSFRNRIRASSTSLNNFIWYV